MKISVEGRKGLSIHHSDSNNPMYDKKDSKVLNIIEV
jgi:hypothetical protein